MTAASTPRSDLPANRDQTVIVHRHPAARSYRVRHLTALEHGARTGMMGESVRRLEALVGPHNARSRSALATAMDVQRVRVPHDDGGQRRCRFERSGAGWSGQRAC
jgi:hypothetical protein